MGGESQCMADESSGLNESARHLEYEYCSAYLSRGQYDPQAKALCRCYNNSALHPNHASVYKHTTFLA